MCFLYSACFSSSKMARVLLSQCSWDNELTYFFCLIGTSMHYWKKRKLIAKDNPFYGSVNVENHFTYHCLVFHFVWCLSLYSVVKQPTAIIVGTVLAEQNIKVVFICNNCAAQRHKTSSQSTKTWAAASYIL